MSPVTREADGSSGSVGDAGGNVLALATSQTVWVASSVVIHLLLARYLGAGSYGLYAFVMGVTGLFVFIANPYLHVLLARRIARRPEDARREMGRGLVTTLGLSAVAVACIVGYATFRDGRVVVIGAAALGGAATALHALSLVGQGIFDGLRRMRLEVPAVAAGRAVVVVVTVLVLLAGGDLVGVFGAQVVGAFATFGIVLVVFWRQIGAFTLRTSFGEVGALLRDTRPFALNRLFDAVYLTADILILKEFRPDDEVGLYRIASILVLQMVFVATVLNRSTYPRIVCQLGEPRRAGEELSFNLRILLVIGVPIALGGLCMPADLLGWLVGSEYREAGLWLALLLPLVPLRFVSNSLGWALSALNRQDDRTRGVIAASVLGIGMNLVLIPVLGALGAVITLVVTATVLAGHHAHRLRPWISGVRLWGPLLRTLVPALLMGAVVLLAASLPVPVRIVIGAAVYGVGSNLSGAWSTRDLARLRAI
ncbi:MAG: polysaccharide biosynthesis protein [Deltaproteobacteria bacterium]|nr:polysaccharide biosynthesis protein [Deltaproteobacteria bacterium]